MGCIPKQPDSGKTWAWHTGGLYQPHTVHRLGLDQKDLGPHEWSWGLNSLCHVMVCYILYYIDVYPYCNYREMIFFQNNLANVQNLCVCVCVCVCSFNGLSLIPHEFIPVFNHIVCKCVGFLLPNMSHFSVSCLITLAVMYIFKVSLMKVLLILGSSGRVDLRRQKPGTDLSATNFAAAQESGLGAG